MSICVRSSSAASAAWCGGAGGEQRAIVATDHSILVSIVHGLGAVRDYADLADAFVNG
jgi:hypothetical protein